MKVHEYQAKELLASFGILGSLSLVMLGAAWLGAPGVLIGQAAGGVIFGAISLVLAARVIRDQSTKGTDQPFKQTRLFQMFYHRR